MANWISSKLKAAENILHQIDQQAAESLKKEERPPVVDDLGTPNKTGEVLPLKNQLKKKNQLDNDYHGKFRSDPSFNVTRNQDNGISVPSKPLPKEASTVTDGDWTTLLGTPNQPSTSAASRSNGVSSLRGVKRDGRKQGNGGSNNLVLDVKKTQNNTRSRNSVGESKKLNGKATDGEESDSSALLGMNSRVDLKISKIVEHSEQELHKREYGENIFKEVKNEEKMENDGNFDMKDFDSEASAPMIRKKNPSEVVPVMKQSERTYEERMKTSVKDAQSHRRSDVVENLKSNEVSQSSVSDGATKRWTGSSSTDGSSGSDSDSGSASDTEIEREREERKRRREKILAEKAAAKAVEVIKEQEDLVARLEGEKQSLEKILEDRARKQAEEASELQTTMMETMEAVELEKQKHNNTRKEALAILAKLETESADLARALASVQWNLELESNRVAGLRQQIELKETTHEELRRRILSSHQAGTSKKQLPIKGIEFELEILEAEYSLITDKVLQLQEKSKKLEENIELMRKEMEEPTEVEVELERRLDQMTDHLIHKQAQVEALSSEKATLLFRIEAVTRQLEENKSVMNINDISSTSSRDLETGKWEFSSSKLRPMFEDKMHSGKRHLGSLLLQLEAIYVAGMVFIRRNPAAKLWSVIYLVCLHFWVLYILMSHSQVDTESGAVISLESINASSHA